MVEPRAVFPSPDGRYELQLRSGKAAESGTTIDCPYLHDRRDDACVFQLPGHWHVLDARWSADGRTLRLLLRHATDEGCTFTLAVDVVARTTVLHSGPSRLAAGTLDGVARTMQAAAGVCGLLR